jgi:hypothetical protein
VILSNLGDGDAPDGGDIGATPPAQTDTVPDAAPSPEETPAPATETPARISFSIELSSGHYTAGIDFPAGTYDIVAVSGGGNVSSSNMFSGGINAIMGVDTSSGMYEQVFEYQAAGGHDPERGRGKNQACPQRVDFGGSGCET